MKRRIAVVLTCFMLMGVSAAWAQPEEGKKAEPEQAAVSDDNEKPKPDEIIGVEIPKINEIYGQAKKAGIVTDWEKRIKITAKAYKDMPEPERAFEVGKTLSDVAFLVLDKKEGREISPHWLDEADNAIRSLNPPEEIMSKLVNLKDGVRGGTYKDETLRVEIDKLIKEVIPKISEKDSKIRDAGMMVWASGFCRAMYLGTSTAAGMDTPKPEVLSMFRYGSMIDRFIQYFAEEAGDSFKNNVKVTDLRLILSKIKPIVEKKPGEFTKEDIANISKILEPKFKDTI